MAVAWRAEFGRAVDVEVSDGNILDLTADAIVSPANSFGFMDGGIDLAYSRRFGWGLQARLRDIIRSEHDGELPVGQAVVVTTGDSGIPFLISAPTMRVPMDVSATVNAYLAFRAAMRTARLHNVAATERIESILCPGLGTGIGRMSPRVCAHQMFYAYASSHLRQSWEHLSLGSAVDTHHHLIA
jgi:O-acetyl-ADP-ribose deacetylase (regulator of RNase III)